MERRRRRAGGLRRRRIADKGILERTEPRNLGWRAPRAGGLPGLAGRGPWSCPSPLRVGRVLQDVGTLTFALVLTYTLQNPLRFGRPLRTRIPSRPPLAAPSTRAQTPWGLQAGLGPGAYRRRAASARRRTRSLRNARPPTTTTSRERTQGRGRRGAPAPRGTPAGGPRLAGRGPSPVRCPESPRWKRPAALASLGPLLRPHLPQTHTPSEK